jgi:hypothetical protein
MRQSGLMAAIVLAGLAVAPSAQAQTGQPIPAWDHVIRGSSRFVVLSDLANDGVLDLETGLVWERAPSMAQVTWYPATLECLNRTTGGRKGWRVPSIFELSTLIDPSVPPPAPVLPEGHPFRNVSKAAWFWSSTRDSNVPNPLQWGLQTLDGQVLAYFPTTAGVRVWCVRAPSADSRH